MEATAESTETKPTTQPELEAPRRVGGTTVRITTPLTDDEKLRLYEVGRAKRKEAAAKEAAAKAAKKAADTIVAGLIEESDGLDRAIEGGHQTDVPCAILHVFSSNERRVVREDTGEVLESRALTADERQTELDFAAGEARSFPVGTAVLDVHGERGIVLAWDDGMQGDVIAAAFCQKLDLTTLADLAAADVEKRRDGLVPCLWGRGEECEVTVERVEDVKRAPVHGDPLDLDAPIDQGNGDAHVETEIDGTADQEAAADATGRGDEPTKATKTNGRKRK